ncbi:MAG: RnfABCDGE type electron transport complex subunit B [Candidatus Aminicenantes bacterium]|nr:RnfABCDGE type electron transport complex subunit B [Candidatus Aminicenantes bacterium]
MTELLVPILTMTALGFLFSTGLVLAYNKLKVEEDPKIEKISEILPQANCGACGYSGCRAFAEAVVKGKVPVTGCPVGGEETAALVAETLGVDAGEMIKMVARLHCRGTIEAAKSRGCYSGIPTCYASHLIGGNKQCSYGCLGYGDCVKVCQFDALYMDESGLPVVREDKCTACGKCVDACPRNLFELHPLVQEVLVFCRSEDRGPMARKVCKAACITCGICARACPDAIVMENNLAVIADFKKIDPDRIPDIEKCPTDAIGRIHKDEDIDEG